MATDKMIQGPIRKIDLRRYESDANGMHCIVHLEGAETDVGRKAFQENADNLGVANPLDEAIDVINEIQNQLSSLPLNAPVFPNIENPLMPMDAGTPLPTLGSLNLPSVDQATLTAQGAGVGGNIPFNQMTTQQKLDILFGRG